MLASLSQYIGTVGMFNGFANNSRIRPRICYLRNMQSCEFGLIIILFILLKAFPV